MSLETDDLRIRQIQELTAPVDVRKKHPVSEAGKKTVAEARQQIHRILTKEDDRLLVIMGPCSIHDVDAAKEYAGRLKQIADELDEDLLVVMRVYFEKPRTTVGWKGLINDPNLDGTYRINEGLHLARQLLVDLADMGVPAATEYLDLISPQYVSDVVSWGAIGARTTESQVHRELASGLSCPVGFKNGTDGNLKVAVDAIRSASRPHHFLSLTKAGRSGIFATRGNEDCHVILRGGREPNYDAESVEAAGRVLAEAGLPQRVMIDFSHANSRKQHGRQMVVAEDVGAQIAGGETRIFGAMVESHLLEGRQDVTDPSDLVYGQSITDACLGWDQSEDLLRGLAETVRKRRKVVSQASA